MKTISFALMFTVSIFASQVHAAYPRNLFSVSLLHYDSVRQPHGPDWYLQSKEAKVIAGSISSMMGIDPAYISLALSTLPSASVDGEETHYVVPVEEGYVYCATRLRVTSIVPADGDRASVINAAVNPKELQMTTWTPVRHAGEGKSWAEGDVQVYGIKPEYLDEFVGKGVCKKVTAQVAILSCRGKATCSAGVVHGDPEGAAPSTPDLSKGFAD